MPEILVKRPFNLRGSDGRLRSFRPTSMRLHVTDTEAQDAILRSCCELIEEQAPAPEKPRAVKQTRVKKGISNGDNAG